MAGGGDLDHRRRDRRSRGLRFPFRGALDAVAEGRQSQRLHIVRRSEVTPLEQGMGPDRPGRGRWRPGARPRWRCQATAGGADDPHRVGQDRIVHPDGSGLTLEFQHLGSSHEGAYLIHPQGIADRVRW